MKTKKPQKKHWHPVNLYLQVKKKSDVMEKSSNLLLNNLLKTNTQLLRSLDVSSSVLF